MLKQKYFLADIFILSAEKQPIKLSWRKIVCLPLQFSERTSAIQDQVKLTLKAERNKSAKEVGIDIFNRLNRQKKNNAQEVSKIRIYGKNENDKDTFIDTTFMEKIEPIKVSINESTGQVQTMEIYRFLKSLILPL